MKDLSLKHKIILVVTLMFCIGYCWSYLHIRQTKVIIHYHGTCNHCDQVKAKPADGPLIFAASVLSNESLETILIEEMIRVELINTVYFPLRKLEEIYWIL